MSIALIQALYNPQGKLPSDFSFYQTALQDIEFFGISPQVYFLLKQKGKIEQTPQFFQDYLKQKYTEKLFQNIFIKNQTEQILDRFEKNRIDVIPLKGVTFAEKYFGNIGARPTSDIDLLVKKADIEKAIECIKLLGFTKEEAPIPNHFHYNFSKQVHNSPFPLTVEIHWDILSEDTAEFNIEEFWSQAHPIKTFKYVKEFSDYHTFYMICLHGWRHNLISLKYFIDIIQLIYELSGKLDYNVLLKDAVNHKTFKRIIRTLSIVYDYFPFLDKILEFSEKRKIPFWDYHEYRNLNNKSYKIYIDYINYQFFGYDTLKHSFIELNRWVLPSKSEVEDELGVKVKRFLYLKLYQKRLKSFYKAIF